MDWLPIDILLSSELLPDKTILVAVLYIQDHFSALVVYFSEMLHSINIVSHNVMLEYHNLVPYHDEIPYLMEQASLDIHQLQ